MAAAAAADGASARAQSFGDSRELGEILKKQQHKLLIFPTNLTNSHHFDSDAVRIAVWEERASDRQREV